MGTRGGDTETCGEARRCKEVWGSARRRMGDPTPMCGR